MLKIFCDGSNKDGFLTLGVIAATEDVWTDLDHAWNQVLQTYRNIPALHMTDVRSGEGDFENWPIEERNSLVDQLVQKLYRFRSNPKIHAFKCTVDLRAHDEISARKTLPSPARICARIVTPHVIEWYWRLEEPIIKGSIGIYFDRNEEFMRHIHEDWKSPVIRERYPTWQQIRTIEKCQATGNPGLQIADMIAWGTNNLALALSKSDAPWKADHEGYAVAVQSANNIRRIGRVVDANALEKSKFEEEGFAVINPQRLKQAEQAFLRRALIKRTEGSEVP